MKLEGFVRQEALALTRCSSSRLVGLEAHGLIVPTRIGNNTRPICLFTWEQLISIRLLEELQGSLSPSNRHAIASFLQASTYDSACHEFRLAQVDDRCFWLKPDWSNFPDTLRQLQSDRDPKQATAYKIVVLPSLDSVVVDIWYQAQKHPAVDFESFKARAKVKPQELAIA